MTTILLMLAAMAGASNLQPDRAYSVTLKGHDFVCFTAKQSWNYECFLLGEDAE